MFKFLLEITSHFEALQERPLVLIFIYKSRTDVSHIQIEDITWPRGYTNFSSSAESISHERAKQTSERCFQHKEITFISPSDHVMFCLFYRY